MTIEPHFDGFSLFYFKKTIKNSLFFKISVSDRISMLISDSEIDEPIDSRRKQFPGSHRTEASSTSCQTTGRSPKATGFHR